MSRMTAAKNSNPQTSRQGRQQEMNDRIRISDAERDQVAARLREHFAEGRLTQDELDERITAVFSAKTYGDLRHVLADLPGPAPAPPGSQPPGTQPPGSQPPGSQPSPGIQQWAGPRWVVHRRGPRVLPLVLLAVALSLLIPGIGWVFFAFLQFLLVAGLLAGLAMIIAAARFRRRMRRQWESGPGAYWHHYQGHGQTGW
jgi:Domain of unknown function (DUF1707)